MQRSAVLVAAAVGGIAIVALSHLATDPPAPPVPATPTAGPDASPPVADRLHASRSQSRPLAERRAVTRRAAPPQLTCLVRAADGTPVTDCTLQLWRGTHRRASAPAPHGVATFSGLAPGAYRVAIESSVARSVVLTEAVRVVIERRGARTIEVPVQRTGELGGRVRDACGSRPWRILAQRLDQHEPAPRTIRTTGSQPFVFDRLPPGRYAVKATTPDGATATAPVVLTVSSTPTAPVWLEPTAAARHLRGALRGDDDAPLAGQTIVAAAVDPDLRAGHVVPQAARFATTRTDADGRFEFAALPAQAVALHLDPRGGYRSPVLEIPASSESDPVRWRATPRDRD